MVVNRGKTIKITQQQIKSFKISILKRNMKMKDFFNVMLSKYENEIEEVYNNRDKHPQLLKDLLEDKEKHFSFLLDEDIYLSYKSKNITTRIAVITLFYILNQETV